MSTVMSTREFAKQTGRQHGNVMTTVRSMIARGELNLPESTWIGANGKALPEFRLSRFDFEKMAYRMNDHDIEVVRRHFGVREMKIEPAPVLVPIGTVTPAAAKAVVTPKESIPATLKLVPPVGAIFLPESPVVVSNVVPFNFGDVSIRVVMQGGEPWWVASDVCGALEIGNSRMAMSRLDDDEKGVTTADTLGGKQELGVVNESGLYSLILKSRKPSAKRFKKWVTSEVLPTIRKTGTFSTAPQFTVPTTFADACNATNKNYPDEKVCPEATVRQVERAKVEHKVRGLYADRLSVAVGGIAEDAIHRISLMVVRCCQSCKAHSGCLSGVCGPENEILGLMSRLVCSRLEHIPGALGNAIPTTIPSLMPPIRQPSTRTTPSLGHEPRGVCGQVRLRPDLHVSNRDGRR